MVNSPMFIEAKFKLEPDQNGGTDLSLNIRDKGLAQCQIWGANGSQVVHCYANIFDQQKEIITRQIPQGTWHSARIEVDPSTMTFTGYVDGLKAGSFTPDRADELKGAQFTANIGSGCSGPGCIDRATRTVTGYFDDVRMGAMENRPLTASIPSLVPIQFKPGSCLPVDWQVVGKGSWTCKDNTINAYSADGDGLLLSKAVYRNVYFEATVSTQDREASFAIRMQDKDNGYIIVLAPSHTAWTVKNSGNGYVSIRIRKSGQESDLTGSDSLIPDAGELIEISVTASGSLLQVHLNGKLVTQVYDGTFKEGRIGLRVFGGSDVPCNSTFTNLVVK